MPVSSSIQYPLAPCAGSTYRLKLSLRPAAPGAAEKLSSPTGISISGGNCAGPALCSRLVMRARLSGPSLPSRLPATRVTVWVEATADCVLSGMPSPLPSPVTAPSGPVMRRACSSRASGGPARSWSSGLAFAAAHARGAAGGVLYDVGAACGVVVDAHLLARCHGGGQRQGDGPVRIHADTGDGVGLPIDQHGKGAGGDLIGGLQGFAVGEQQLSGVHGDAVAGVCIGVHMSMCASAGRRVSMSKWRTASGLVPGAPASLAVLTLRLLDWRCTPLPAVSVALHTVSDGRVPPPSQQFSGGVTVKPFTSTGSEKVSVTVLEGWARFKSARSRSGIAGLRTISTVAVMLICGSLTGCLPWVFANSVWAPHPPGGASRQRTSMVWWLLPLHRGQG